MMKTALTLMRPLHGDHDEVIAILEMPHRFNRVSLRAADNPQHGPDKNQRLLLIERGNKSCRWSDWSASVSLANHLSIKFENRFGCRIDWSNPARFNTEQRVSRRPARIGHPGH